MQTGRRIRLHCSPTHEPLTQKKEFSRPASQAVCFNHHYGKQYKQDKMQWDWCLTTLPVLYIKFWISCTISIPFSWVFCDFLQVCIIRQFPSSGRWEESMGFVFPRHHPKLTLFLLEVVPIICDINASRLLMWKVWVQFPSSPKSF